MKRVAMSALVLRKSALSLVLATLPFIFLLTLSGQPADSNTFLSVLTALTIVLGMRMMGAMLISSLVIFPALTAMGLLRSFRGVVLCAGAVSVVCFCIGLTGSYLWSTPVGATVVLVNLAAFLLSRGVMRIKRAA